MGLKEREEFSSILSKHFGTEESERLMDLLENKLFFKLPASSRYHSSHEGGLVQHSINVYRKCMELKEFIAPDISDDEIAIVALFHDLNKIYAGYQPNTNKDGSRHKTQPYKANRFIADYDSFSCYLITDLLKISISPRMYNAICNQNIFHPSYFPALHNTCIKNTEDYSLVLLLQMSDMYCSMILERDLN